VDAVLVTGDIFDTGAPPSYARELFSDLVVKLHRAGVALLLLGGSHVEAMKERIDHPGGGAAQPLGQYPAQRAFSGGRQPRPLCLRSGRRGAA